jgi:hypothetical protein
MRKVEPAAAGERAGEGLLARMPERRVADIVREAERLGEVLVEPERAGERPADLGHLDGVGQPGAVVVALVEHEHLGLVLQPAERGRMDDAVGIAPERAAAGARRLGMKAPAAPGGVLGVRRARIDHGKSRN